MLKINGKSIYLTRGDYAEITVTVVDNDTETPHTFTADEKVIFRVGGAFQIEKECTLNIGEDTCLLVLEESDTAGFRFGTYKYEFEYINANGKPDTFIANQDFHVTPEQEEHND